MGDCPPSDWWCKSTPDSKTYESTKMENNSDPFKTFVKIFFFFF